MRRSYSGGAKPAQLTVPLGGTTGDLTITCDDLANYPTGSPGPFYVVIGRGTATEEKILCSSRNANVLTVYNDGITTGRGSDGTTVSSHSTGAEIEHIFTATDADEANAHVNASSAVHGLTGSVVGSSDTQTLTNKTLTAPTISNPSVSGGTFNNSTFTNSNFSGALSVTSVTATSVSATSISSGSVSITGSQTLADYRARNVYAATAAPTAGTGNDGDMWVQYEA